jgi:hypothetical protein
MRITLIWFRIKPHSSKQIGTVLSIFVRETVYRYNFNNGILKVYAAFDSSKFDINQESINSLDKIRVALNNYKFILQGSFGNNWQLTLVELWLQHKQSRFSY